MANEFKVKKGLIVEGSGGTILDIQGSVGQLFSITDSLTGDLFAVSDISGIPILNVNSSGAVDIDGDLSVTDDVTLSNFGAGYLKTNVNGVGEQYCYYSVGNGFQYSYNYKWLWNY